MKKTLKEKALVIEMIAGIAVGISLIFLAFQFKENTRATKSANESATNTALASYYFNLGNNSESSKLFYEFMAKPDSLAGHERFQAVMNIHGAMLIFQNSFYLMQEGTLDSEMQNSLTSVILAVKDQPGWHFFWEQRKSFYLKNFRLFVEDIMASEERGATLYKSLEDE